MTGFLILRTFYFLDIMDKNSWRSINQLDKVFFIGDMGVPGVYLPHVCKKKEEQKWYCKYTNHR